MKRYILFCALAVNLSGAAQSQPEKAVQDFWARKPSGPFYLSEMTGGQRTQYQAWLEYLWHGGVRETTIRCQSEMKNLEAGLEMWSADHRGAFPKSLKQLLPNYLAVLPSCPQFGNYRYTVQGKDFRLDCGQGKKGHDIWLSSSGQDQSVVDRGMIPGKLQIVRVDQLDPDHALVYTFENTESHSRAETFEAPYRTVRVGNEWHIDVAATAPNIEEQVKQLQTQQDWVNFRRRAFQKFGPGPVMLGLACAAQEKKALGPVAQDPKSTTIREPQAAEILSRSAPTAASEIVEKALLTARETKHYRATIVSSSDDVVSRTRVVREGPKLRIDLEAKPGQQDIHFAEVFDGTQQKVLASAPQGVKAQSLDLATTLRPGSLFDTFLQMEGAGLSPGEDLSGTVEWVLTLYDFAVIGTASLLEQECWVLKGTPKKLGWQEWLHNHWRKAGSLGPELTILVEKKSFRIFEWSYNSPLPSRHTLTAFESKPPIDAATWSLQLPAGTQYQDVTTNVQAARILELLELPPQLDQLLTAWPKAIDAPLLVGTPWLMSCQTGLVESAQVMLRHGACLNETDAEGQGALHYAAVAGGKEMVEFLLTKGLTVDSLDKSGQSPLHLAAEAGNLPAISALLKAGAKRDRKNAAGKTPWQLANPDGRKLLK